MKEDEMREMKNDINKQDSFNSISLQKKAVCNNEHEISWQNIDSIMIIFYCLFSLIPTEFLII